MIRTLYLIRHASAENHNSGQKDVNRTLTSEGQREANHLGIYLAGRQVHPDIIIASSASRALETAETIAGQMKYGLDKIKKNEELYEAPIRILLSTVNALPVEMATVLLIAHNPGISFLADYLTGDNINNMTPCSVVAISFDLDDWSLVAAKTGNVDFIRHPD